MSATYNTSRIYLWFDTEFTDLDPNQAQLLQVALVATDSDLNRLLPEETDLNMIIKLEEGVLVSDWVQVNLSELVARCRSDEAIPVAEADGKLAAYVKQLTANSVSGRPVMAGNSVYADMIMARKHLPKFAELLHYRLLDSTTLKILWEDWHDGADFDKDNASMVRNYINWDTGDLEGRPHDAYYDLLASLAELNYYREKMGLRPGSPTS